MPGAKGLSIFCLSIPRPLLWLRRPGDVNPSSPVDKGSGQMECTVYTENENPRKPIAYV